MQVQILPQKPIFFNEIKPLAANPAKGFFFVSVLCPLFAQAQGYLVRHGKGTRYALS